ncbi:MAG: hypothetical protein ACRD12_12310 [Acidimicrobiales bacterium]
MVVQLRRITPVLALLLALAACGSDTNGTTSGTRDAPVTPPTMGTSFCQAAQKAIGDAEAAIKTLTSAQNNPAEMRQSQQQITVATNLMIQALQSPPAAIAGDAPVAIGNLQQIVAATNNNSTNVVVPTPAQATANQNINNYLQTSCGIRSTNLFASN